MSVSGVAFVPSAPLLIPAVAGGSAGLDAGLRAACLDVVDRLVRAAGDEIAVAAPWTVPGEWSGDHTWGFEGFGVERVPADSRARLPWPLGVGAWLLDEAGYGGERRYLGVDRSTATADAPSGDVALLVVGDGTARRTEKAPGHLDVRAEPFDAEIARLIAAGDALGLATLDAELADSLMCGGAAVWRWLGGLIGSQPVARAELGYDEAPYGVGYFVGYWEL